MFSKSCEYAIKATIFIAEQSLKANKVGLKAIAKSIESPEAFTAKTLQKLRRDHVISSDKGPNGGFYLNSEQLANMCLKDIVAAIDGSDIFRACGLGLKDCSDKKPCPVHFQFKSIRDELKRMLETTNIKDLAKELKDGNTFLKR